MLQSSSASLDYKDSNEDNHSKQKSIFVLNFIKTHIQLFLSLISNGSKRHFNNNKQSNGASTKSPTTSSIHSFETSQHPFENETDHHKHSLTSLLYPFDNPQLITPGITHENRAFRDKCDNTQAANPSALCPYFQITSECLSHLSMDFNWDLPNSKCYCEDCSRANGNDHTSYFTYSCKDPYFSNQHLNLTMKMKLGYPYGWCRYPIPLPQKILQKVSNWHISYHGTTKNAAMLILADGCLKVPDGKKIKVRPYHTKSQSFFTTPSIKYASFVTYALPFMPVDTKYFWQVIIEVRQKPNSYVLHPQTLVQGHYIIDPTFPCSSIAWKSSQSSSAIVSAVLLRRFTGEQKVSPSDPGMPSNQFSGLSWWQPWEGVSPVMMYPGGPNEKLTGKCGCADCCKKSGSAAHH